MNPVLAAACIDNTITTADCDGLTISSTTTGTISNSYVIDATNHYAGVSQLAINLDAFTNTGTIIAATGSQYPSFSNSGSITTLTNTGSMISPIRSYETYAYGIRNLSTGTITTLNNSGSISSDETYAYGIRNENVITTIANTGLISVTGLGWGYGISNSSTGTITMLNNSGSITVTASSSAGDVYSYGIRNENVIATIANRGLISGVSDYRGYGISNIGTITTLTNSGSITGTGSSSGGVGISNSSTGTITTLTNTGSITGTGASGSAFGISNYGTITTLNNAQSNLTYYGALPTNYNIIINDSGHYGQLSGTSVTGSTAFGINAASLITSRLYTGVLQGLADARVGNARTGTYDNMNWTLALQSGSSTTWDLSFTGTSLAQTQSSLASHARKLSGTLNIASLISNFSNSNTYDCNLFDVKGMCISAGGRYSTVDNPSSNSSAAVVTLGYKVSPNIRIGGFLDQSVNNNAPTGINLSNKNPMMGVFAYWNQNADGLGYQVKIANAYQDKDLTTTRDVIGTSEAGTGKTSLNARSYVGELSYAFMYKENTLVRPYFALRHTSIEQDAYTETGVATPLTYSALNDRTTSALMGVKFKHALTPKANLIGSLGVEQDLHNKTDRLTATGIAGLTSENLSSDLHRTRPVASIGATYDIAKSQRLSGEVLVQQLPFQSTTGATAYFNYMIGF